VNTDPLWLKTREGQAWLDSDEGHAWLVTEKGNAWFVGTEEGRLWGRSAAGDRYMDALEQGGWDSLFSRELQAKIPEHWFTPETAPRIGSRVRFAATSTTLDGTTAEAGELAIVTELRFIPAGAVYGRVRTIDGRKTMVFSWHEVEPA
jgi:hypothetical protein